MIEAGQRLSLQRHELKDESDPRAVSGRLRLYLEDDDGVVRTGPGPGRSPARRRPDGSTASRRSSAASSSRSRTPELDDVVRLEDDFGREGTERARDDDRDDFGGDRAGSAGVGLARDRHSPVEVHDRTAAS